MISLDHEIPVEVHRSDQDREADSDYFKEVYNTRVESEENTLDVYRVAANETPLINNCRFRN